ncbi:TBC1 domain family member 4 isoform X2 [Condylostylus longicornis]|uniref:TBC1 domain family member 4 isoform X2 n=1 Tax=Condylostylus longicornis TaxID=2530218 RepID=UPI00244E399C|nr:TBC1 domain family member 4 isoform X2 [Condylostylus longicornis]
MKTKLIGLTYRGEASVDPRFSAAMLPWTISDIRSMEVHKKLSVGIENGQLEAYNADFELQLNHHLKFVVGVCRINFHKNCRNTGNYIHLKTISHSNKSDSGGAGNNNNICGSNFMEFNGPMNAMVYLIKDPRDPLLHVYLYESDSIEEMTELMHQMRDPVHNLGGSVGNIPQSFVPTSGSDQSLQRTLKHSGSGSLHSTPGSNLKLSEACRNAQHDASPNLISSKMSASKSYTHGLSNSAGTVNIPQAGSVTSNLSLLSDISPNHTHFFEVLYVGKIRVSHKRVPHTFIDDAIPKFKAYDAQRTRLLQLNAAATKTRSTSMTSESESYENIAACSKDDKINNDDTDEQEENKLSDEKNEEQCEINKEKDSDVKISDISENQNDLTTKTNDNGKIDSDEERKLSAVEHNKENKSPKKLVRGQSQIVLPVKKDVPKQRDRSASYGCIPPYVEQNRTMVFLVGRSDLRLISPDRKQVLLYKDFKDVASCAQGHKNSDHFGIICREGHNTEGYIGYVFKCQSEHVCDDIVSAISQAFITCSEQKNKEKSQIFSCEHCPMLWYHKLCTDIEGLSDKKTQAMIFRRIETLSDDEQDIIWAKYYGAEKINSNSLAEQNQFLMMLLRAHCESRQQRHVHDTAENRSEFLNQYLGGSTIFMKAKRSLTNSFDHLLKRKSSRDDYASTAKDAPSKEVQNNESNDNENGGGFRSRSNTWNSSQNNTAKPAAEQLKSPMMDIFMKVGNSPKDDPTAQGSWRQAILNSVVTPSKGLEQLDEGDFMSPLRIQQQKTGKRTREELRELWKTAIRQTILLSRMEKENAMLQARQNENEIKKIKLDYDEICQSDKQLIERWELIIGSDSPKKANKKDPKILLGAIKNGVPRSKRGDIWTFLAEQHSMNTAPVDTKKFPNFNTPYYTLLKNLTEHQHAIFIDLGRTFPNHKYYKDPLGVGQLSLFNLLKAYSILDPELGYCQGLGFICGILLLHCNEEMAFQLLKHLMFRRKMRERYLPDMKKFQLQLYQLSRLVKDQLPDLYEWLDRNDVSPTLYAAPWLLTVFSSQFPLGFVARIFDLLFLESPEVIFKAAIALLTVHKEEILARDNFEEIMDYLKTVVPKIDENYMNQIMKVVFSMEISKSLTEYQVEYNVLQEEIQSSNHHLDMLKKEKENNHHLETQLQFAQSSIAQLEKTRASQQSQITSLQSQVQSLELTIQTLGRYVAQLVERNSDLDLPSDIRRIIQQLDDIEKQRRKPIFIERKIGKSVSMNSNLGYPLKVLEELNESDTIQSSPIKKKPSFFGNTYEHIRQQQKLNQRPNRLIDTSPSSSIASPISEAVKGMCPIEITTNSLAEEEKSEDLKLVSELKTELSLNDKPKMKSIDIGEIISPLEIDSGMGTPMSPPSVGTDNTQINIQSQNNDILNNDFINMTARNSITSIKSLEVVGSSNDPIDINLKSKFESNDIITIPTELVPVKAQETIVENSVHPLSACDINVRFNGTTQLKSIRPVHYTRKPATSDTISNVIGTKQS